MSEYVNANSKAKECDKIFRKSESKLPYYLLKEPHTYRTVHKVQNESNEVKQDFVVKSLMLGRFDYAVKN